MPTKFSSLTGYWSGGYQYPAPFFDWVPFNATLEDRDGALAGEVDEPNTFADPSTPRLFADLFGQRVGQDVRFVKSLDGAGGANHDIVYEGVVDDDFMRIEGTWTIPGDWSGAFFMERINRAQASAEATAEHARYWL